MHDVIPEKWVCLGSRDLIKYREIRDNISEKVQYTVDA